MKTETATKERPIIFTGENVLKILDGTKTQTRRIVKRDKAPQCDELMKKPENFGAGSEFFMDMANPTGAFLLCNCPYGKPGDRLWVRETWRPWWDEESPNGTGLYCVVQYRDGLIYKPGTSTITPDIPDENIGHQFAHACDEAPNIAWRSPIHMPRWASRLTLEITDVRVRLVQKISEAEAMAEGFSPSMGEGWDGKQHVIMTSADKFFEAWNKINGAGSWESNPWVWAITFRVVT